MFRGPLPWSEIGWERLWEQRSSDRVSILRLGLLVGLVLVIEPACRPGNEERGNGLGGVPVAALAAVGVGLEGECETGRSESRWPARWG
jgi:hypothetical protein